MVRAIGAFFVLAGVNGALRYYAGDAAPDDVRGWILDGFRHFARVQGAFMDALADD